MPHTPKFSVQVEILGIWNVKFTFKRDLWKWRPLKSQASEPSRGPPNPAAQGRGTVRNGAEWCVIVRTGSECGVAWNGAE